MKKIVFFKIFILILFLSDLSLAQEKLIFSEYEDSLKTLGKYILNGENDFVKYSSNEKFINLLKEALLKENSYEYPFDSLITIARLVSPDNTFRIFNWNLPKDNGTYEYFGFIQSYNKIKKKYEIFSLIDKSDEIESPETKTLDNLNWYGVHYYKIIETKVKNRKYYTLLGWDGNNKLSTKKIIEILHFRSNGSPVFGAYLFRKYKKKCKRVIFEYAKNAFMSLKYEEQRYNITKKNGEKIKTKKTNMIVFDRLVPLDERLTGQYEFYVPETNIFDAFIFQNRKWVFIKDVDARNPKQINKNINKKPINYDLFPKK